LGTAGCVKFAESLLTEPFLVISGDLLTDFNLKSIVSAHRKTQAIATLVLTRAANPLSYGVVIVDEKNAIQRFLEKPSWGEVFSDTVNTGIYMLDPAVLEQIPKNETFDFSRDLFHVVADASAVVRLRRSRVLERRRRSLRVPSGALRHFGKLAADVLPGRHHKRGEGEVTYGEGTQLHAQAVCEGKVVWQGLPYGRAGQTQPVRDRQSSHDSCGRAAQRLRDLG